jgi:hypothetical protein
VYVRATDASVVDADEEVVWCLQLGDGAFLEGNIVDSSENE